MNGIRHWFNIRTFLRCLYCPPFSLFIDISLHLQPIRFHSLIHSIFHLVVRLLSRRYACDLLKTTEKNNHEGFAFGFFVCALHISKSIYLMAKWQVSITRFSLYQYTCYVQVGMVDCDICDICDTIYLFHICVTGCQTNVERNSFFLIDIAVIVIFIVGSVRFCQ